MVGSGGREGTGLRCNVMARCSAKCSEFLPITLEAHQACPSLLMKVLSTVSSFIIP